MKRMILFTLIAFVARSQAQWSYSGLGSTQVTGLTLTSDTVYASTYDGIYKKGILDTDTSWLPCGMQGYHVVQSLVPDGQTFISLVEIDSSKTTQIYKSVNGGISFVLLDTSVGRLTYNFLKKLAHPEGNYDTLYLVNHIRKTFDGGATWTSMGDIGWTNFIEVDPGDHSRIIAGGEGLMMNAKLETSTDFGDTWTSADMNGYFQGDNSLHDLAINGNDWFGVGEGVICRTSDGGAKWTQLLNTWSYPAQWQLYIFAVEMSPVDKNRLYATGDGHGAQRVPLLNSSNYGQTWDTLSYNCAWMPRILSLAVASTEKGERVFLGGKGVFTYDNIVAGLEDLDQVIPDHFSLSQNYPNPFNPSTVIDYALPTTQHVRLSVFDVLGRNVATVVDQQESPGRHTVLWDARDAPSGVYFYRLTAGSFVQTRSMVLIR